MNNVRCLTKLDFVLINYYYIKQRNIFFSAYFLFGFCFYKKCGGIVDICNGESIFCENIWKESFVGIRRLCEYKLRSRPDEVDDVISEVYLALITAVHNKKAPTNPKAWLYAVANNIIKIKYSQMNKDKHSSISMSSQDIDDIELAVFPDLSDEMISDADIVSIADKIFLSLSDEEQQILTYFHYENKSIKEIAAVMGKSESAVKQKHYRLCWKVKRLVKEYIENY